MLIVSFIGFQNDTIHVSSKINNWILCFVMEWN